VTHTKALEADVYMPPVIRVVPALIVLAAAGVLLNDDELILELAASSRDAIRPISLAVVRTAPREEAETLKNH
jgi:hypothetical protein